MAGPVLTQNIVQYPVGSGPVELVNPRGTVFGSSVTSSGGGLSAGDREVLESDCNAPVAKDRAVSGVGQSDDGVDEIHRLEREISELENEILQQAGDLSPMSGGRIMSYEDCIRGLTAEIDQVHQTREALKAHFSREFAAPLDELVQTFGDFKGDGSDQVYLCRLDQQTPVPLENVLYSSGFGVGLSSTPTPFNWNDVSFPVLNDMFISLDVSENYREADFARDTMNMSPSQQPVLQEGVRQSYAPPMPGPQMGMAQHHTAVPVPAPPVDVAPMNGAVHPGMASPPVSSNKGEVHPFSEPPDAANESPKPDDNSLSDRISQNTIIWKLFEKLLQAFPAWLRGTDKPECEAGLNNQVLENLQKEESSLSSTSVDNKLDALKEKKARLESICSYLKDQRAHLKQELSQTMEWVNKIALFVKNKEVLKGIINEGRVGDHGDSPMVENSQPPLPQAAPIVHP
ncbi:hypothetical protein [Endozoicomonas atrinae]|uniref:hypothetical protein n=1 Tax=Endozoicomonas atrinae TaxID=1333660 RepID=UPI000826299C|nr:hypothetical protein [Endozoicomonas atrinae]